MFVSIWTLSGRAKLQKHATGHISVNIWSWASFEISIHTKKFRRFQKCNRSHHLIWYKVVRFFKDGRRPISQVTSTSRPSRERESPHSPWVGTAPAFRVPVPSPPPRPASPSAAAPLSRRGVRSVRAHSVPSEPTPAARSPAGRLQPGGGTRFAPTVVRTLPIFDLP